MRAALLATIGFAVSGSSAVAQWHPDYWMTLRAVEGDGVGGIGSITGFTRVGLSDTWVFEATTDDPEHDVVRVEGATATPVRGQSMWPLVGVKLDGFGAIAMNGRSQIVWVGYLRGAVTPDNDSGLFQNDRVISIRKGDVCAAAGLAPETRYTSFNAVKLNLDGQVLLAADVDDPAVPGSDDAVLLLVDDDLGRGAARVLWKDGDILPQQSEPLEGFGTGAHSLALSSEGRAMFVATLAGSPDCDTAIYLDHQLIAQEGGIAPISGCTWGDLRDAALALSSYPTIRARLEGDPTCDEIIVTWNGYVSPGRWEIVAQKGGPVPAIPEFTLTQFGTAIAVDSHGTVFWHGAWEGGEAIFAGGEPVIVAGETSVEGRVVAGISSGPESLATNAAGQVISLLTMDDGAQAVLHLEPQRTACWIADCDSSGVVDFFDFLCFAGKFAAGHPYCDCDGSGAIDLFDFLCFQDVVASGCP